MCENIQREREREMSLQRFWEERGFVLDEHSGASSIFRARRRLTLFFLSFSVLHSKGVVVGVFRKQRLESSNETLWR